MDVQVVQSVQNACKTKFHCWVEDTSISFAPLLKCKQQRAELSKVLSNSTGLRGQYLILNVLKSISYCIDFGAQERIYALDDIDL